MAKKPANSAKHVSFAGIQIDDQIDAIVDSACRSERAVQDAKQGYRKYARKRGIAQGKQEQHEDIIAIKMNSAQIVDTRRAMLRDPEVHRQSIFPSNHNKRDQGFNGWSREFNQEARTGVVGKPPKRRPKSDGLYRKYPFAPR